MDSVEPNTGEEEEGNTMDLHSREDILEMKTLIDQLPEEDCTTIATPMDSIVQITREDINPLMDGDGQDAGSYEPPPLGKAAAPMYRDISIPELSEEMFPLMGGDGQNAPLAESRAAPMYREVQIRELSPGDDNTDSTPFTRERIFAAASQGDKSQLNGLFDYLRDKNVQLSSKDFTDEDGNTALMYALLHLKNRKNDTIEELVDIAEKTGDLEKCINASHNNSDFNGQTALHIAIVRRSLNHVKLLVQKGADVQAKANGKFFQPNAETGFYFGELPLSLAACTNQAEIVSFLIDNEYRSADLTDQDSQGNTVLHALVVIADNTTENTDMFASMYDSILIQHNKLVKKRNVQLEAIENNQGLTPLKLAAKFGKIGLFEHLLHREFQDKDTQHLSRKLPGWNYGPVQSSLYDMSSIDTDEHNSVLRIVVCGNEIPNQPEMLLIEPLRSILQDKWDRFASKLFLMNFLVYVVYLSIFTTVAFYRKEGKPPFPLEVPVDYLRCIGEVISVLGAVWFIYKAITIFKRNRPNFKGLYTVYNDFLFFLQASLLLMATVLYFCGKREYIGFLVISLALAWINVLYYSRGSKQLGIYNIMIQRMILGDLLNFLCVYSVLLFGFSAAIVALMKNSSQVEINNGTLAEGGSLGVEQSKDKKQSYYSLSFTLMEMFKFTIGMGNLEFTDHVHYKAVFHTLLILYIVLTYILLFNMLIALMGNTVERISQESENIWNMQRAFMILDIERTLPLYLKSKLYEEVSGLEKLENRRFIRVDEINWKPWRSDAGVIEEEEPGFCIMKPQNRKETPENTWSTLLKRIRARRPL